MTHLELPVADIQPHSRTVREVVDKFWVDTDEYRDMVRLSKELAKRNVFFLEQLVFSVGRRNWRPADAIFTTGSKRLQRFQQRVDNLEPAQLQWMGKFVVCPKATRLLNGEFLQVGPSPTAISSMLFSDLSHDKTVFNAHNVWRNSLVQNPNLEEWERVWEEPRWEIYTDGSFSGAGSNPRGAYGVVLWRKDGEETLLFGGNYNGPFLSSTRMETFGIAHAVTICPPGCKVTIYTDAQNCVFASKTFVTDRKLAGTAKRTKYIDFMLWEYIAYVCKTLRLEVQFIWVKAHAGNPGNELADRVATHYLMRQLTESWKLDSNLASRDYEWCGPDGRALSAPVKTLITRTWKGTVRCLIEDKMESRNARFHTPMFVYAPPPASTTHFVMKTKETTALRFHTQLLYDILALGGNLLKWKKVQKPLDKCQQCGYCQETWLHAFGCIMDAQKMYMVKTALVLLLAQILQKSEGLILEGLKCVFPERTIYSCVANIFGMMDAKKIKTIRHVWELPKEEAREIMKTIMAFIRDQYITEIWRPKALLRARLRNQVWDPGIGDGDPHDYDNQRANQVLRREWRDYLPVVARRLGRWDDVD